MEIPAHLKLVHSSDRTVLLVDDDAVSLVIMENLLQQVGSTIVVRKFSDPLAALKWANGNVADLVVMDCLMPQMSGIDFLRAVRALPGYEIVPMLMVTVVSEKGIRYEALTAGVTDFLTKPVDLFECFARCKNLLALRLGYRGSG